MSELKQGSFLWWCEQKGYGLIESDGARYFAHILHLEQGSILPRTGYGCTFRVSDRPKRHAWDKQEAVNIVVLGVKS